MYDSSILGGKKGCAKQNQWPLSAVVAQIASRLQGACEKSRWKNETGPADGQGIQ